jgi:predicted amidohydrolase
MQLKIAAHQLSFQTNKKQNLNKILNSIDNTNTHLHIFPEYSMGLPSNGLTPTYVKETAEQLNGPFVKKILTKTKQQQTAVVFTIFLAEQNQYFNAAILAEKGKIKALYKKLGHKESTLFTPGDQIAIARIQDFRVGLAICFDLRFPELFRTMAYKGVDLFAIPSAWYIGKNKIAQWKVLTKTRAHENNTYLVAVNQNLHNSPEIAS